MQGGHNIALRRWGRCRKVLTCPGNVVGGAKRQQRRCWDMEALFSSFHIEKGGVGWQEVIVVVGLAIWWCCGRVGTGGRRLVASAQEQ